MVTGVIELKKTGNQFIFRNLISESSPETGGQAGGIQQRLRLTMTLGLMIFASATSGTDNDIEPIVNSAVVTSGVIVPVSAKCPAEQLCFPDKPLAVYSAAKGEQVGNVKRTNRFDFDGEFSHNTYTSLIENITWSSELSYDANAMEFINLKDNFLLIAKTETHSLWLVQSELIEYGFKALTWPEFLGHYSGMVMPLVRLNMRTSANATSKRITQLDSFSDIRFTGKFHGYWAQVEVVLYDKHYCYGDAVNLGSYIGWIKYYDEQTQSLNVELGGSC